MSGFSAGWLALREPADRAARNGTIVAHLAERLEGRTGITIVDLGAGTGASLRALAPCLPGPQSWRLLDLDPDLLAHALACAGNISDRDGRPVRVATRAVDLSGPLWQDELEGADLVTASALLDLVDTAFLERLAAACRTHDAAFYAALTVDGRLGCHPADPMDEAIFAAFNAHMRRDKGVGPALGPGAAAAAGAIFRAQGWHVEIAAADWRVASASHRALASDLVDGWVDAVAEMAVLDPAALAQWHRRRQVEIVAGELRLDVGHLDLLAMPA
ncbi:hypothetical protein [Ancylobacter terrae]|uniref:hypothetical protein n=1 Tax=Ancylobacter sp. sgz301288 TaxID=3342077 RepID=UPI00385DC7E2